MKKYFSFVLVLYTIFLSPLTNANTVRNIKEYNLDAQSVGLKGFDPVSYFVEGGGKPQMGLPQMQLNYLGVNYFFSSQQNQELFLANPAKYEPTYGGYCAYAMASGAKVDIQPTLFTIHDNRIHFFVSRRAKENFDADVIGFETRADDFWKQISGEEPRK